MKSQMIQDEIKRKSIVVTAENGHCRGSNCAFVVRAGLIRAFEHAYNESSEQFLNDDVNDFVRTSCIAVIS